MSAPISNAFIAAGGTPLKISQEIRWGYLIILLFFGGVIGWAAIAPLSTAAIAPGVVIMDGYRKTVQHLEGGIVEKILVRDGDRVVTGQPLLELQRLATETEYKVLQSQRILTATKESRLAAEYTGSDEITFLDWLQAQTHLPEIAKAIAGQQDIFVNRRNLLNTQKISLAAELAEAERELTSYLSKAAALERQRDLIVKEIAEYERLSKKGFVTRIQFFPLKRQSAEIDADISNNQAVIATSEQRIAQLKAKTAALVNEYTTEVAEQLRETRDQLVEIEHLIGNAKNKLERTTIRAPVDGIVINLKVHTLGGVIQQGEGILDIVPINGEPVVEAHLDPKDRDMVKTGLDAQVRFSAFNQRAFQPIPGRVINVSADAVQGTDKQQSYYLAKIQLLEDPAKILNGAQIQPGMQADVLIVTGERTALEYFVAPFLRSFTRAMREQ